ncbi:hypothetical protein HELRODRAFT_148092, partial [Helobdella robusta]|uniref:Ribosomal protein n=1 Tax=Helobdella robusta TaxID=6412 RepID=T1EK45_HELRO
PSITATLALASAKFLSPHQSITSLFPNQVRTYKVKTALKRRCPNCYFVRRHNRLFVECTAKPRHKQMQ